MLGGAEIQSDNSRQGSHSKVRNPKVRIPRVAFNVRIYDTGPVRVAPTGSLPAACPPALAGCFGALFCATTFCATTHAADAIAHEMKNAVHGSRALGAARSAGPQTTSVNRLSMPASAISATRCKSENSTPRPQAICPAPLRVAQPTRYASHASTTAAGTFTY